MDRKGPNSGVAMGSTLVADDGLSPAARESFAERHYTVDDIAKCWQLSRDKVQRIFQNEPGVVVIEGDGASHGKRRHRTLRIPASVAERVHRRLSVVIRLQHK